MPRMILSLAAASALLSGSVGWRGRDSSSVAATQPPAPKDLTEYGTPDPQEEGGRGLFLVATLSARWDWYLTQEPRGKVVWCELEVE